MRSRLRSRRSSARGLAAATALLAAPAALGQLHEGDVAIDDVDGAIAIGVVEGGELTPENVFGVTFGDQGIPAFTSDPGYNAPAGTFSPGSRLGFNFRGALERWDGEAFSPLLGGGLDERLRITFFTAEATSGEGFVPGFDLQVQPDGGYHTHLGMTLLPADGEPSPQPGVYLMELELYSTDPDLAPSEPYWFVFGHEADPVELAEAEQWVRDERAGSGPACPADLDGSGAVGFDDLLGVLSAWGGCETACPADLDGSGAVDFDDVLNVLSAWGPCSG